MTKSVFKSPIFYIAILVVILALSFYAKDTVSSATNHLVANLNIPSRYAFITDSKSPQLAVVDTYDKKWVQTIKLQSIAELLSLSRVGGTLVYTEKDSSTLYFLDLDNAAEESQLAVKGAIKNILMHADGYWLSYATDSEVVIYDVVNKTEQQRIPIESDVGLTYSPDGLWLFISEKNKGKISQYSLKDQSIKVFEVGEPISAPAILPDSQGLIFTAKERIYRLNLVSGEIIEKPFPATQRRPYITNDSRVLILLDDNDNELVFLNPIDLAEINRIALHQSAEFSEVYTGWLEQVVVLGAGQSLLSANFQTDNQLKSTAILGEISSAMVQSDSKTLLATTTKSKELLFFDMNKQVIKATILLPLSQPNTVLMGQTNTLCH